MDFVEPKVFVIARTEQFGNGLRDYLEFTGAGEWRTDALTFGEEQIEGYGRLCYRSWFPGMNANVTKVREGNRRYIENLLSQKHGSVLEHVTVSFIFVNVSRVFTHELVRHRVGTAISQMSLRYVRLLKLAGWLPKDVKEDTFMRDLFREVFEFLEDVQRRIAEHYDMDESGLPFRIKKIITSLSRRFAPEGLATEIAWTANLRTLRHVIERRTDPSAEIEMRVVFCEVARLMLDMYPAVFQDFEVIEQEDGYSWYKSRNGQV